MQASITTEWIFASSINPRTVGPAARERRLLIDQWTASHIPATGHQTRTHKSPDLECVRNYT